jgi:rubredoxin
MTSAMTTIRPGLRDMPKQNPCAQCGAPIAMPEWIEEQEDRTIYLWRCHACDYHFEAIAFFEDESIESPPLAA